MTDFDRKPMTESGRPAHAPTSRFAGLPIGAWIAIAIVALAALYFLITGLWDYPAGAPDATALPDARPGEAVRPAN